MKLTLIVLLAATGLTPAQMDFVHRQDVIRLCHNQVIAQYRREVKELPGPADPDFQSRLNTCIKALGLNP